MPHYLALMHASDDSAYRVAFPDFPDCDAGGKTPAEAWLQARKVLSSRVEHLRKEGKVLPTPSRLSAIANLRAAGLHEVFSIRI